MNNDQEEWGVLESLFLKGEQLTAADREVLLQERSASDHLRSRLWALWRQGDRTESFLAANVLSNFTVFADGGPAPKPHGFSPGNWWQGDLRFKSSSARAEWARCTAPATRRWAG